MARDIKHPEETKSTKDDSSLCNFLSPKKPQKKKIPKVTIDLDFIYETDEEKKTGIEEKKASTGVIFDLMPLDEKRVLDGSQVPIFVQQWDTSGDVHEMMTTVREEEEELTPNIV